MSAEITWRPYAPADREAVLRLKQEQDEALGKKMDLPDLASHPVLVSEVAVDELGEVVGAYFFESVPEFCMVSRSPEVTAHMRRRAPETFQKLKACGFRVVRVEVPRFMDKDETDAILWELELTGKDARIPFEETDTDYRHVMFDLR
jgi:hypothetical protein